MFPLAGVGLISRPASFLRENRQPEEEKQLQNVTQLRKQTIEHPLTQIQKMMMDDTGVDSKFARFSMAFDSLKSEEKRLVLFSAQVRRLIFDDHKQKKSPEKTLASGHLQSSEKMNSKA